jgi:hypothetical protein
LGTGWRAGVAQVSTKQGLKTPVIVAKVKEKASKSEEREERCLRGKGRAIDDPAR